VDGDGRGAGWDGSGGRGLEGVDVDLAVPDADEGVLGDADPEVAHFARGLRSDDAGGGGEAALQLRVGAVDVVDIAGVVEGGSFAVAGVADGVDGLAVAEAQGHPEGFGLAVGA